MEKREFKDPLPTEPGKKRSEVYPGLAAGLVAGKNIFSGKK